MLKTAMRDQFAPIDQLEEIKIRYPNTQTSIAKNNGEAPWHGKRALIESGNFMRVVNSALSAVAMMLLAPSTAGAQTCNTTNTPFQGLYALQASTGTDRVTIDTVSHRYTFKPQVNMTMCSIGYQSPPGAPAGLTYKFILTDLSAPPPLQDITLGSWPASTFSATPPFTPTHVAIAPVNLVAGNVYKLRRVATGSSSAIDLIGRVLTDQEPYFPISAPNLKITHSKFYGGGGPLVDRYLPFIDFGIY